LVAPQAAGRLGTAPEPPKPQIAPSSWWTRINPAQADLSDRERLFALWLGAAAVMLKARLEFLLLAPATFRYKPVLAPWLPLAAYQDLLLIALASWTWWTVLPLLKRPLARRAAYVAGWMVGLFVAGYAVLNFEVYRSLQVPLTYQLVVFSKNLDYLRDSLAVGRLYAVLLAPLYALAVAVAILWFSPRLLGRAARGFHSWRGAAFVGLYAIAGMVWGGYFSLYRSAFQNPEWQFYRSMPYHNEAAFLAVILLWPRIRAARAQLSDRERLFAAWLGAATVMVNARLEVLQLAQPMFRPKAILAPWLPLAAYQDLLMIALLGWTSWIVLPMLKRPGVRRAACVGAWVVALFAAGYAALNVELYRYFQGSLTYQLIVLSNHLDYIGDSLAYFVHHGNRLQPILLAPLYALLVAIAICRLAPGLLRGAARAFHSPLGATCVLLYVLVGIGWAAHWRVYQSAFRNPEWAFAKSLAYHNEEAFVAGKFPSEYLDDFMPAHPSPRNAIVPTALTPAAATVVRWRPRNVVLLIGESLGSRYLGIYGAPYADSPEMERLAQHGALFQRTYVSCPYSDNAVAALFTSVYPYHYWQAVITRAPQLSIPGIGSVLQSHGYRVAFIHSGNLADTEQAYLRIHGFQEVHDKGDLPGFPHTHSLGRWHYDYHSRDSKLVPAAMNWIGTDRTKPFFLALWTDDTHSPYTPPAAKSFGVPDGNLNRYLGAVEETDANVAELERELAARGLLDDTLVVVTGDHGEQFGQHGKAGHGFSLYDEEVRIPLIIANPRLFPHGEKIDRIARQIDIAPTILEVLGFDPPENWQGQDLFAGGPERRAYLFADYHYGLVDGNYKYIYDVTSAYSEIYDLSRDPLELNNLSGDSSVSKPAQEAYTRMAAWSAFQNKYLNKFDPKHN
jgi:arylsulfatase A-like enzyme